MTEGELENTEGEQEYEVLGSPGEEDGNEDGEQEGNESQPVDPQKTNEARFLRQHCGYTIWA